MTRRMTYSFRSKAAESGMPAALPTKNCRMTGCRVRASQPICVSSTGTSRQPRKRCPSASTVSRMTVSHSVRFFRSCGRKTMPTPYSPSFGSATPSEWACLRKKASGIWNWMPEPSPVSGSQHSAPRCSRLMSTSMPCSMMVWVRAPRMLATMPTPQLSCSWAGEYSPRSAASRCAASSCWR